VCPGGPPYAEVTFFGATDHDIFQMSPPFILDQSFSDSNGSGRGIASLPSGQLKATATADPASTGFSAIATGVDTFTLGGLAPGTPVTITATLDAAGTGLIPIAGGSGSAMIQLGPFGGAQAFDRKVVQAGNQVPVDQTFFMNLFTSVPLNETVGTPFPFDYFLRLDAANLGASFDFLSTATLKFTLPQGVTISSEGNYSPASVPEPATVALVAPGLLALGAFRRWRQHA